MIDNTTLTERYIHTAVRTVPEAQRGDLAAELRASIEDSIDARASEGETRDAAERAVLVELGDPDKLAAGYTERPLHLIGPRYFLEWWRLLKLLTWIVVPLAAFGVSLGSTLSGATFGDIVATTIGTSFSVAVNLAFWTTLVFAIIERSGPRSVPLAAWSLDQLPEPRERGAGFGEMLSTLIFLGIAAGAILWDQFVGFLPSEPGLSFLDDRLWPWWIAALFVLMALEAAVAVAVYARGRWTLVLASANALLNLVVAVPAIWLLTAGRLVNADFWPTVIPDDGGRVGSILAVILGFVIAGVAIWSAVDGFLKARVA